MLRFSPNNLCAARPLNVAAPGINTQTDHTTAVPFSHPNTSSPDTLSDYTVTWGPPSTCREVWSLTPEQARTATIELYHLIRVEGGGANGVIGSSYTDQYGQELGLQDTFNRSDTTRACLEWMRVQYGDPVRSGIGMPSEGERAWVPIRNAEELRAEGR